MGKYTSLFWQSLTSPSGLLGMFILLLKPIKIFVEWMGDLDLIVEYWPKAMAFLDTGLGFTATFLGGAIIISYAVFKAAREQPEMSPPKEPHHTPEQRLIQTEAITDDNPKGTWARVGRSEPNYAIWGKRTELRIDQAAKLMAGQHGDAPGYSPEAMEFRGLLLEATSQAKIGRSDRTPHQLKNALVTQKVYGKREVWDDVSVHTPITLVTLLKFLQNEGLALDFVEKVKPYVTR